MVVDPFDSKYDNTLLWCVRGTADIAIYIDCVMINYDSQINPVVWGYSVYRRSPGFRTLGISLHRLKDQHSCCMFFDNRDDAIVYFRNHFPHRIDEAGIRDSITPNLKFLKKNGYFHSLTESL